jgi:hypothetical protein
VGDDIERKENDVVGQWGMLSSSSKWDEEGKKETVLGCEECN